MFKRKTKIAGRKILIEPLPAKKSLEAVILLSGIIHDIVPHLMVLAEPSRAIRVMTLLRIMKDQEDLPEVLFSLVSIVTDISVQELETQATLEEILDVLVKIIKVNDWNTVWESALYLRIIDRDSLIAWLMARIPDMRTR